MTRSLFPALLLVVAAAGCGQDQATSYRVPKEKEEAMAMPAAPPPQGMPMGQAPSGLPGSAETAGASDLKWKAPAGWKELPASGMRLASFVVPGSGGAPAGDLSIVALPGDAGGNLANVNRWRGQLGLDALDEKALEGQSKRIKTLAGTLLEIEYAGPKGRMFAAILNANGNTWFFKLTGDESTLGAARTKFLEFLNSLHFS